MVESTLIIIKPDAIQRQLAGEIITRLEKKGFQLTAAKFMQISKELSRQFYSVHQDKEFFEDLVNFTSSSPVLIMIWQADGIIDMARKMLGATFGYDSQPGTIRGDFSCSNRCNLAHASDGPESAEYEIKLFFSPDEIVDYKLSNADWLYTKKK